MRFASASIAALAVITGVLYSGPLFSEPSGNVPRVILMVTVLVAIVVVIVPFARHSTLSRALRELQK